MTRRCPSFPACPGAGPSGSAATAAASTPFAITGNIIEDCDYGVLLGWFGYAGRVGPVNCIVSNNIIRRPRSCGIQNNGGPGAPDGARQLRHHFWTVSRVFWGVLDVFL